ncbi:molybdopterin guanine dinucleotide-containing S/N-oxide reductases [Desulfuromusa kysingii]|uniref:Molybdopterin guanine dinucleotide-containing S/N-oxide reductases n=1 Tax=Desulfuromusa kysingii TaxID=37625 RepID=A0A1H4DQU4_9BACT|nr:molybdopterin-dependent oxidoreductase [Desulfuromusa kysingii]SEA74936.1 molybdopterin guanine dinucleotide-containing S/N-oxide reductases [Desulfuromusa kysingii]
MNDSCQGMVEKVLRNPLSRRKFLKTLALSGAMAMVPGSLLQAATAGKDISYEDAFEIFRNACPRNCYDTCSIKTFVKDGVIQFIEGASESTFTDGGLCVKGFSYPRRVYSPDRIKYPMMQVGRGSGNWKRLSWDEAIDRIAEKILEINEKDGNLLGLALDKYSGNFGITHYGVEGMMSSLGYTTRFVGTPCWPAGIDAQNFDMGEMWCNDPEDMVESKYIIVWGANPAWCSVHSMKYIFEAKKRGAKIVVIDPVMTQTAAKADMYLQVDTATDGALALGMARHLLDQGMIDREFVNNHSLGFEEFSQYLKKNVTVTWAAKETGIPAQVIKQIAEEFAQADPATIWIGYGMQRHVNGGAMVRAIDALVAMTGNVGKVGGGARYGHLRTWGFNYNAMVNAAPEGAVGMMDGAAIKGDFHFIGEGNAKFTDRPLNMNQLGREILQTQDPKIRMLWLACRNPFSQDPDTALLKKAFDTLEMVVVVDQFFTKSVEQADIVLPHTTLFEENTVNVGYWHYWLSLNEQAIKPMYESRSDVQIAAMLSKRMNERQPGSCTFPTELDTRKWMEKEFNKGIYDLFGLNSWKDLRNGPAKAKLVSSAAWHDFKFKTPSGKYEFKSELAAQNGHKALPEFKQKRAATGPLRLLTPHSKFSLHSQFQNLDFMEDFNPEPIVYLHPTTAKTRDIEEGVQVRVFNQRGQVELMARLTDNVPPDVLLMYEAWFKNSDFNVQNLLDDESADMGSFKTGAPGIATHDQFANIQKA